MIGGMETAILERLSVLLSPTFRGLRKSGKDELFAKPGLIEPPPRQFAY